jgi:uncharacterized protein (TIGR02145 family)
VIGKVGQAVTFDGVNDSIAIGTNSALATKPMSVSFWAKSNRATSLYQGPLSKTNGSSWTTGWGFFTENSSEMRFFIQGYSTNYAAFTGLNPRVWHHYVGVWDGTTIYIYVDGIQGGTTDTYSGSITTLDPMHIGIVGHTAYNWQGPVDEVRVYNRALSQKEIITLFKAGGGSVVKSSSPNTVALKPFTCGTSNVTDADGNIYNTLRIGSQCWMKQNLRVGTRINIATAQSDNGIIEKYCYDDTASNCTDNHPNQPDGGLYRWDEAMQYSTTQGARGICPSGWHIPTHDEFTTLERSVCTLGSCATDFPYDTSTTGYRGTDEGTKLKANGSSGVEVNLTGYDYLGGFYYRGTSGFLWSSTENGAAAWYRAFDSVLTAVYRETPAKYHGIPVRCLKN